MLHALATLVSASWTLETGARIAAPSVSSSSAAVSLRGSSILDLPLAERWFNEQGLSQRHLLNVYRHVFRRGGAFTPHALNTQAELPRAAANALCDQFAGSTTSSVVERVPSEGGLKLVVELKSGHKIETVLILHDHKSTGKSRCTVCVSSQVGCARACSFCATGTMGLRSQLSGAEILEQVWHARNEVTSLGYSVRNVVFMGMGEPLDNFDAVLASLRGLTHQSLFDLAAKHLTVSTVGASPDRIRQLADTAPKVRLALSLHSATQDLREQLIPSATGMTELCDALDYHARATRCGLMVEYLLIDGVNDGESDADALAAFCLERDAAAAAMTMTNVAPAGGGGAGATVTRAGPKISAGYVNLIPFNPTEAGSLRGYETPSDGAVERFHARLRDVHGVHALCRWKSATGRDAAGACGQLVV